MRRFLGEIDNILAISRANERRKPTLMKVFNIFVNEVWKTGLRELAKDGLTKVTLGKSNKDGRSRMKFALGNTLLIIYSHSIHFSRIELWHEEDLLKPESIFFFCNGSFEKSENNEISLCRNDFFPSATIAMLKEAIHKWPSTHEKLLLCQK